MMFSILAFIMSAQAAQLAFPLYPNKSLTPGKTLPVTAAQVCKDGYTANVRDVTETTKKQVFQEYGIPYAQSSQYEVDHFVSLELGGSNDKENLWPQPYCLENIHTKNKRLVGATAGGRCLGAREKDVVETNLHREVCAGTITLTEAQQIITTDWVACYHTIKAGGECLK